MTESEIKKQICDWLETRGALPCIMGNKSKMKYSSKYMRNGIPDLFCLWEGQATFIEVKKPKGKVSEDQINFMHSAMELGALCFIAESLEDVMLALEPN